MLPAFEYSIPTLLVIICILLTVFSSLFLYMFIHYFDKFVNYLVEIRDLQKSNYYFLKDISIHLAVIREQSKSN